MKNHIEQIVHGGRLYAVIVPSQFRKEGIDFFTPPDFSQQLAYMNRPAGYVIGAHVHNKVDRHVSLTLEVLFIRSGRVRLDLYDSDESPLCSRELCGGDIVLLAAGGHGLTMLEASEIVEVKQGPYAGDQDKRRFVPKAAPA